VLWRTVDGRFRFSAQPADHAGQRFCCVSALRPDEHVYGFGGRIVDAFTNDGNTPGAN
jgi:hypothetical protein